ncbi:MAG TPA: TylF/MycF/NovP-related O-methyltransferase [Candidatus Binataceae bacterium]|nr:TylF/MycF/NovP-related O-methyltransferase [Candidatus Binataceae bacterium]
MWDWPMVNLGWRPARTIPLAKVYFQGDYGYEEETDIKTALEKVYAHSTASLERLATLWLQVRYLDRYAIRGDLVECGVWKGGAAGMMALAHMRSGEPYRKLQLFDSFKGMPEPKAEFDGSLVLNYANGNGALRPIGQLEASVADCEDLLFQRIGYPEDLVQFHEGWFQDTLPRDAGSVGDVSLLRIAADWYESTVLALQYLYSKVASKGVVIIADYGTFEGARRATDEFLARLSEPIMLHHIDADGRYWIKP